MPELEIFGRSERLNKSLERVFSRLFPGDSGAIFVEDRSPPKIRKTNATKVAKESAVVLGDKAQKSMRQYFSPNTKRRVKIDKDQQNKLISALCFIYGFEVFESEEVGKRNASMNERNIFGGQCSFEDIYDIYAYLKKVDEEMTGSETVSQKMLRLRSPDNSTVFLLQYELKEDCRTLMNKGFGTYPEFLELISKFPADARIAEISQKILQSYLGSQEKIDFNPLSSPQFNILKQAIFTLIAIEPRRNPAAVILNAMALDLIAGGKEWSDLISPAVSTSKGKKRTASIREGEREMSEGGGKQIPMTASGAVKISESLNISFKQLLEEGEYSNFGSVSTVNSDAKLESFLKSQADFFQYWVEFKHQQLAENSAENFQSLKLALEKVKIFGEEGVRQEDIKEASEAYKGLIEEFLVYFYQGLSLAQCSDVGFITDEALAQHDRTTIKIGSDSSELDSMTDSEWGRMLKEAQDESDKKKSGGSKIDDADNTTIETGSDSSELLDSMTESEWERLFKEAEDKFGKKESGGSKIDDADNTTVETSSDDVRPSSLTNASALPVTTPTKNLGGRQGS